MAIGLYSSKIAALFSSNGVLYCDIQRAAFSWWQHFAKMTAFESARNWHCRGHTWLAQPIISSGAVVHVHPPAEKGGDCAVHAALTSVLCQQEKRAWMTHK